MNIQTIGLNINDIKSAIKYSTMDKESLLSYIGKVILTLNLENNVIKLNDILSSIFVEIIKNKYNKNEQKIILTAQKISNHITDELNNYLSVDTLTKEQIELIVEPFIDKIAFMKEEDFESVVGINEDEKLLSIGLVSDALINDEIISVKKDEAINKYNILPEKITNIIENIKMNIIEKSKNFNEKIKNNQKLDFWSKSVLGLITDIFGGNLVSKMIYTDVLDNEQMLTKIKEEGIVHLTSNYNAEKILNSENSYIRASNALLSGGKRKTYFFAGLPSFKDITINIYSYNVMYGVRIRPTDEQIEKLTYREYNDKAVAYNGNFHFSKNQVEKVYYGLKIDENGNLFYQEITETEAKNYQIDDKLKQVYNGDASIKHKILCNAYGFYYELENYKKLLNRIKNRNFNIEDLEKQKNR